MQRENTASVTHITPLCINIATDKLIMVQERDYKTFFHAQLN